MDKNYNAVHSTNAVGNSETGGEEEAISGKKAVDQSWNEIFCIVLYRTSGRDRAWRGEFRHLPNCPECGAGGNYNLSAGRKVQESGGRYEILY